MFIDSCNHENCIEMCINKIEFDLSSSIHNFDLSVRAYSVRFAPELYMANHSRSRKEKAGHGWKTRGPLDGRSRNDSEG